MHFLVDGLYIDMPAHINIDIGGEGGSLFSARKKTKSTKDLSGYRMNESFNAR